MEEISYKDRVISGKFLYAACRDYVSSRTLYFNNELISAGILAHEAIEKVFKAVLYWHHPDKDYSRKHSLIFLSKQLYSECGIDLSQFKEVIDHYEDSYKYRYPDSKKPKSYSASTLDHHNLDALFFFMHDNLNSNIKDKFIYNSSGIMDNFKRYSTSRSLDSRAKRILTENKALVIETIDEKIKILHSMGRWIKIGTTIKY